MKKLIIHAGFHKTGTSAIQHALFSNKDTLVQHGFFYPDTEPFEAHHSFFARLLKIQNIDLEEAKKDAYRTLRTFLDQAKSNTVLVSSEMICEGLRPEVFQSAFTAFDRVEIHFYVRNQLELVESAYNQQVKQNGESRSISQYLPYTIDLYSHINQYRECFNDIKISCHLYDKSKFLFNNLIADFLYRVLNIHNTDDFFWESKITNESLSPIACVLLRYANCVIKDKNIREHYINKLFHNFSQKSDFGYKLMTDALESKILNEATFCNKRLDEDFIKANYFQNMNVRNLPFLSDEKAFEIANSRGFDVIR